MAKKSAMSKGYRKQAKAKPFLSKKEIIALVVILAVILIGVILFNIIYDDGYIKAREVQSGDVVSFASAELKDRYKKIAEIGSVEGFTLADRGEGASPTTNYTFNADGDIDNITHMTVGGSFVNASALVDSNLGFMTGLNDASVKVSNILDATIQGYDAQVYSYTYSEYINAEGETEETPEGEEDNSFNQVVSTYIDLDGAHTLSFHIYSEDDTNSYYLAEDQLIDYVEKYSTAFTMVPKTAE